MGFATDSGEDRVRGSRIDEGLGSTRASIERVSIYLFVVDTK